MADVIKPCPCCGERSPVAVAAETDRFPITGTLHFIHCRALEGGCGTRSGRWNTKREAVRAWNRRATPPEIRHA